MTEDSNLQKKRVSILGCGWLGFPLAQRLIEEDISKIVKGSTTTLTNIPKFNVAGIEPFLIDLGKEYSLDDEKLKDFFNADILVIAVPPRSQHNEDGFYSKAINRILPFIHQSDIKEVIHISSTGVYPNSDKIAIESDVTEPGQSPLADMVLAENHIQSLSPKITTSILRLAGLLGYQRIPGRYVKGKKDLTTGEIPVNYIHRDDAVDIILHIIRNGVKSETFNVVAPLHPTRKEVYLKNCEDFDWEAPTFKEPERPEGFKIISGEKLDIYYNPTYKYANPLDFFYQPE